MQHSPRLASLLFALPLSLLAACDETETGTYGQVEFTPEDCGTDWCDLDDRLAVDATTGVYLSGVDGASVDGLHIETSAPSIAEVIDEDADGLLPRATIVGNRPGTVDVLAVDARGEVVDFITIEVAAVDGFVTDIRGTGVDGPHYSSNYNALYFLTAGQPIDVDVTAMSAGGQLMGRMSYETLVSAGLAAALAPGDAFADGHFRITPPVGEHDLTIAVGDFVRSYHFTVE